MASSLTRALPPLRSSRLVLTQTSRVSSCSFAEANNSIARRSGRRGGSVRAVAATGWRGEEATSAAGEPEPAAAAAAQSPSSSSPRRRPIGLLPAAEAVASSSSSSAAQFSSVPQRQDPADVAPPSARVIGREEEGEIDGLRVDASTSSSSRTTDATSDEKPRRRKLSEVPISEVLKAKHTLRWVEPVICKDSTVREGILICVERGLSGMMVVDRQEMTSDSSRERGKVVGMTTSRDLLRMMAAGFKDGKSPDDVLNQKVGDSMTPLSQVIYGRPEETIGMCRTIMAKLGVKCLPILKDGRVEGLISARDMSDYGLDAKDRGGKKNYLRDVSERVGLSANTSMAEPPPYLRAHLALQQTPLFVNVGVSELPHPFKTAGGVGMNHRDFGPEDFSTDPDLSEDAYFVSQVGLPDETGQLMENMLYMGVADGVGSWREYDVDPRDFSHKLMEECQNILGEAASVVNSKPRDDTDGNDNGSGKDAFVRRPLTPSEVLAQAYERVKAANVIGSSTACVGLFDSARHQLHFSNLGDSGIIVLRHIDSDVAGALKRNRKTPRTERKSDLRVAFVSQQQLRSFNHPYQLGWTGEDVDGESSSFKSAADSCTTSIHVRRGDIILMATDGLFDNVDIDDIAQVALEWEQRNQFIRGGDIAAREKRWASGSSMTTLSSETVPELAQALCRKARENSLDNSIDSPFAILAKENDIMWSGGMPDDCTVIAMHVVGKSKDDMGLI